MDPSEMYFEQTLPKEAKSALEEVKQVFGESEGAVTEGAELAREKKRLQNLLSKYRNIRAGPKKDEINLARHQKRMEIRSKLAEVEDRLENIRVELSSRKN